MNIVSVTSRYALRSLFRSRRRTLLSAAGIGIGVAIAVVCLSWIRGERAMITRAAAESGAGHLRIIPKGALASRDIRLMLKDSEAVLSLARSVAGVKVATPRLRVQALLGMGTRTVGVELVGVDAITEPQALRTVRRVDEGRYLKPGDDNVAVIGKALAERLDLGLGDDIVVTVVASDGALSSAMAEVVGVVATGSKGVDEGIFQMPLASVQALSKTQEVGEVTVLLEDHRRVEEARGQMLVGLDNTNVEVATYRQIAVALLAAAEVDVLFLNIIAAVVVVVVFLGLLSAQLATELERRRETAVLAAIGMSRRRIWALQVKEALALGGLGAAAALAIAVPVVQHFAVVGVDLSAPGGEAKSVSGVLLDPVLYPEMGIWIVPYTLALAVGATVVGAMYPAWFAGRTEPASAMRGA